MPTISIKRRHTLSHAKAKAAADEDRARPEQALRSRLRVGPRRRRPSSGPGLSGNMHVGKNVVRLDVQLSFLLTPLKGPIEREIHKELDALFGKA